ncbi:MAG: ABC transporter permease [Planctomycetes bacterium]|nr:ABC transporter permease [Planctomycetota bacterium]
MLTEATLRWIGGLGAAIVCVCLLAISGAVPLRYNFRNLTVRWRTTLLTVIAFTFVIGLLTVMLSFVNGMQRLTESSGRDTNVLVISASATDEAFSSLTPEAVSGIENLPGISREGEQPLCSRETYLVVNQPIEQPRSEGPKRRFLQLRGVDNAEIAARVHEVRLHPGGSWFSAAGVQQGDADDDETVVEAVIGEGAARELGRDASNWQRDSVKALGRLDVGDTISMGGRRWRIVGVMQSAGSTMDSEIWTYRPLVAFIFGKQSYTTVVARCASSAAAGKLAQFLEKEYKVAPIKAFVETAYYAGLSGTNQQFTVAIMVVAFVMAVGGVFGIMNTMFAAISQRIKDIGVMRIIGFSRTQILTSFMLESLLIAFVGAATGCLLGSLVHGLSATSVVGSGQGGGGKTVVLKLVVDSGILSKGMILGIVMGFVGGLLPAGGAMRLKPLDAVR